MNKTLKTLLWLGWMAGLCLLGYADTAAVGTRAASAPGFALPAGITEEMLAPPPVPRFMLERPERPLTTDEMMQQVHEAEARARPARRPASRPASDRSAE